MRYKVGTRVRIKPLEELKKYSWYNEHRFKFVGLSGVIQRIDGNVYTIHMDDKKLNNHYEYKGIKYSDNGWFWREDALILENINRRIS